MSDSETTPLTSSGVRVKRFAGRSPSTADVKTFLLLTNFILGVSLAAIFGFSLAAVLVPFIHGFILAHSWVLWLAMSLVLCIVVINLLLPEAWSAVPAVGASLFVVFVLSASYCFGALSATFTTVGVAVAVGMTVAIIVAVSLFAHVSGSDFSGALPYLVVALAGLALTAVVIVAVPSALATKLWAALGAVIFSLFLVFDTQWLSNDLRAAPPAPAPVAGSNGSAAAAAGASSATTTQSTAGSSRDSLAHRDSDRGATAAGVPTPSAAAAPASTAATEGASGRTASPASAVEARQQQQQRRRCDIFRRPPLTTTSYVAAAARLLLDCVNVYALVLFATSQARSSH
jgi:FtsH-binding integral membrane protein